MGTCEPLIEISPLTAAVKGFVCFFGPVAHATRQEFYDWDAAPFLTFKSGLKESVELIQGGLSAGGSNPAAPSFQLYDCFRDSSLRALRSGVRRHCCGAEFRVAY